jgi:hypothetical protein
LLLLVRLRLLCIGRRLLLLLLLLLLLQLLHQQVFQHLAGCW